MKIFVKLLLAFDRNGQCGRQCGIKIKAGLPPQFALDFGGIDGITAVMAGPVFDELDQVSAADVFPVSSRLAGLPEWVSRSKLMIRQPALTFRLCRMKFDPMNPAPPVTGIVEVGIM